MNEGISSLTKKYKKFQTAQVADAVVEFRKYQLYNMKNMSIVTNSVCAVFKNQRICH